MPRTKATKKPDASSALYTPSHVANFFLDSARREGKGLTMLQLQKLVFFGYGWILSVLRQDLFDFGEHPIRRYRYGPVVESLHEEFKRFRNDPILLPSAVDNEAVDGWEEPRIPASDVKVYRLLRRVWGLYKRFTGEQMTFLTHKEGTPWYKANQRGDSRLDHKEIRDYFDDRIKKYLR